MILTIDIGKGTEDILLLKSKENVENSIQLVLPSSAFLLCEQLKLENSKKILFLGELMAGEPYHKEIYRLANNKSNFIAMTNTAARSLKYNLNFVKAKGINILEENKIDEVDFDKIYHLQDILWDRLFCILQHSQIPIENIEKILICAQDHRLNVISYE